MQQGLERKVQKTHFPSYVLIVLLVAILFMVGNADSVWSASVDLAHHYALVFRLGETWHLVPNDPTLLEMNVYPRLSHVIAALAGTVFGSPFLGMHLVTLGALVLLWASCLALLYAAPGRNGALAALALAVMVYVNHGYLRVHGAEIAPNYFFSQLVAQALGFLVIVLAIRIEAHWNRNYVYAFFLACIWVLTDVHLLPALELLGLFAGLLLLDLLRGSGAGAERKRALAVALAFLAAGIGAVVLHPAFAAMRSISENNGELILGRLEPVWTIAVLCLIVLGSTVPLLLAWWRAPQANAMYKYLALYGAAIAGLCLLQMALRAFNLGSDYAVKKYAFGLASFLFLRVALWVGDMAGAFLAGQPGVATAIHGEPVRTIVFGLALLVILARAWSIAPKIDTSDIVAAERQLITVRDSALSAPSAGKSNLVLDIAQLPPTVNYMFSLAITRTPREVAGQDFFAGNKLGPWERYGVIVSSRSQSRYSGAEGCASNPAGPLALLDPACLATAQREAVVCKGSFDFSAKGRIDQTMLTGFSGPEPDFRWTEGRQASFTCKAAQKHRLAKLSLSPFLTPALLRQRVSITVNGAPPVTLELTSSAVNVVELLLPEVAPGQPLTFKIDLPDAKSPQALGLSGDSRELGVAVRSLSFG
jgi:hypothetical protein